MIPDEAALALVPGLERGAPPLRLERLSGGAVNDSWRVDTAQGRFVLRVDGVAWRRPGVDRARERLLHAAAATAGLAPRLICAATAPGVQVCEFLDGRTWEQADLSRAGQLDRLGERLAQLHEVPLPSAIAQFDPGACARQYVQLASDQGAADANAGSIATDVGADAAWIAATGSGRAAGTCIVHGDLVHGNLLEGAKLWLLDWEYAQRADPIYNIACVLAYHPQARLQASRLLAAAGMASSADALRLAAAIRVYQALTWLWHQARGEVPPKTDFRP